LERLLQIVANDFANAVRQDHAAVPSSFFPNPQQTARKIDILDIDGNQGTDSQAQGAQKHSDNEISQTHG